MTSVAELHRHIDELVRRLSVNKPVPPFSQTRVVDTTDERVRYVAEDRRWEMPQAALRTTSKFAPEFEKLTAAGYSWVNVTALGILNETLILGVEKPRSAAGPGVPTSVNYSGPYIDVETGDPNWEIQVTFT
jgi:hypothetical protein